MAISHLLNRTLAVRRPSRLPDGYGGAGTSWAELGTVPARVSRPAPSEREVGEREGVRVTHDVYLDVDADVARGDQLVGDGQTLEVVAVTFPSRKDYLKAECREDVP